MRENVDVALRAHAKLLGGPGDWLLNSALGLMVGAYADAHGKVLDPAATTNAQRFHAFTQTGSFLAELRPDPPVDAMMGVLTRTDPFLSDTHDGAFAFWSIYRNGFTHSFAPRSNHLIEFSWGRYPQRTAWVKRSPDGITCVGDSQCQLTLVDVIDLNVDHVGRTFVAAAQSQENDWANDVANGVVTWRKLLARLQ